MRLPDVDMAGNVGTFAAVFLGALLATVGGVAAGQLEAALRRRERERWSALLFGEILSTLSVLVTFAMQTRGVGDPYGPITLRMLRAARREIEVYDRNRESLYEIRDGRLRVRIHTLILRITMPLDTALDADSEVRQARAALKSGELSAEARAEAEQDLVGLEQRRDQSFDFVVETAQEIAGLVADLARIARYQFAHYDGPRPPQRADSLPDTRPPG